MDAIRVQTNKPLETFIIQENGGTISTIEKAVRAGSYMAREASLLRREEFSISELIVGTECGGSDPTSGLASNPLIGELSDRLVKMGATSILSETKGGHSVINAVYDYGKPVTTKGLVIMDTPGNDPSSVAGMVAGGAQIVVFSTGRGTPTGNPIAPVVKLTGNKITYANMIDNIDFDASSLIYGEKTMAELGSSFFDEVVAVANGKQTKAEALGYTETAIARLCNYV